MQKMGSHSQPIGICQRFMNLIFGILSHPASSQSVEVPIEEGSSRNKGKSSIRPSWANGSSGASEIVVESRHIVDAFGSSIHHVPKKDASSFRVAEKSDVKARDNGLQQRGGRSQERDPVAGEREAVGTNGQKNGFRYKESTDLSDDGTKLNNSNEETKRKPLRRPPPLLSADSNINEKAESFIQSKRKPWAETQTMIPKKT